MNPIHSGRRIAILCHADDRRRDLSGYLIYSYVHIWKDMGLDVYFVYGTRKRVPAEVAILHVDLSIVPNEYLAFARQYRVCLNARVADIRKSAISTLRLGKNDAYAGPVIVKSNLNNAGNPERRLAYSQARRTPKSLAQRALRKLAGLSSEPFIKGSALDYELFDRLGDVPPERFSDPAYVVEKFLPDKVGDTYYTYLYQFLGAREVATRVASKHPIVCAETMIGSERVEPHPDIIAKRRALEFDYGKFDYVMHGGKPILLDTNKTVGGGNLEPTPLRQAGRRYRAEGILDFLALADERRETALIGPEPG